MITPHYYSIVSGIGESQYELVAFDKALLAAGIGDYNLVKVSSIIPPHCEYKEIVDLPKGSILYTAYSYKAIDENKEGSTAVAIALPTNPEINGVIYETASDDIGAETVAIDMCKEAMASRNVNIKKIRTSSIVINGTAGRYTCGISAVVMW